MGYDRKYGHVATEFGNIGIDEPVVVFRAQDALLPSVLAFYANECRKAGSPPRHIDLVNNTRDTVTGWQNEFPDQVRIPNSESSRDRLPE